MSLMSLISASLPPFPFQCLPMFVPPQVLLFLHIHMSILKRTRGKYSLAMDTTSLSQIETIVFYCVRSHSEQRLFFYLLSSPPITQTLISPSRDIMSRTLRVLVLEDSIAFWMWVLALASEQRANRHSIGAVSV
jgi:hypothetical protein